MWTTAAFGSGGRVTAMSSKTSECNNGIESPNKNIDERVTALEDTVCELGETVSELQDEIASIAEQQDDHDRRLDALGRGVENANAVIEDIEDELNSLSSGLEDSSEGERKSDESVCTQTEAETPIEELVELPETIVEEQLTANQKRARFIARDVREYTSSVMAGRAIRSGELRRVLVAGTDANGHPETVQRVMKILAELGKDQIHIKETQGKKKLVFDQPIVKRLRRLARNHAVVREGEVSA
jgi:chromosome segregation ATPase